MKQSEQPPRGGRLFHSLVLMGGSLALGCGGSVEAPGPGTSSGGAAATGGSPATGGGGGTPASGGASSGGSSTGGITSGGSSNDGSTGGAPATGGVAWGGMGGGFDDCPPAQWDCSTVPVSDEPEYCAFYLPAGCACDPTRPSRVDDCAPDEAFVCQWGVTRQTGQDQFVGFECSCLPMESDWACDSCPRDAWTHTTCTEDGRSALCGCELTLLR